MRIKSCRVCGSTALDEFLSFGLKPLADGFLVGASAINGETLYPLDLAWCSDCSLMQVTGTVPREKLFCESYPYYSSYSSTLVEDSRTHVDALIAQHRLDGPVPGRRTRL